MLEAGKLRAEALRLQMFARFLTDAVVLAEIRKMRAELEQRARLLEREVAGEE